MVTMTDNDKTQVISELTGMIEAQCDSLRTQIDELRKRTIGILQALRADIEADQAIKQAERTNESFERMMRGLNL